MERMQRLDLTTQPDSTPTRKVVGATIGAAFATVFVLGAVWLFGVEPPPVGFEGGLATVMTFVLGFFVRERDNRPRRNLAETLGDSES